MNNTMMSAFRKVDLHVHTAKSVCYGDSLATPEQVVDAALAENLEVIAITDHNSVGAIEDIRRVARNNGLFVFPGIELSTKSGHVIALFEMDTPVDKLEDFLDYVGVDRKGWGDAHTLTTDGIEDTLRKIERTLFCVNDSVGMRKTEYCFLPLKSPIEIVVLPISIAKIINAPFLYHFMT